LQDRASAEAGLARQFPLRWCAALATCLDSTIRSIANHLGRALASLEGAVSADGDVRGMLVVDRTVPVGFSDNAMPRH